jgi:hypothetical protein
MHNPFALLAEPEVTRKNGGKLRAEESVAANAKAAVIELEEGEADPTFKQQPRRKPKPKSPKLVEPTLKSQGAQIIDKLSRGMLLVLNGYFSFVLPCACFDLICSCSFSASVSDFSR